MNEYEYEYNEYWKSDIYMAKIVTYLTEIQGACSSIVG
jgi:hypothetical protein